MLGPFLLFELMEKERRERQRGVDGMEEALKDSSFCPSITTLFATAMSPLLPAIGQVSMILLFICFFAFSGCNLFVNTN